MFFVFLIALLITISNEMIARQGTSAFKWAAYRRGPLLINSLIHAGLICVFSIIFGRHIVGGIICAFALYILANINFFKYAARNEFLYASDFLLFFKVMSVSDRHNLIFTRYNLIALAINISSIVIAVIMQPQSPNRLVLAAACLLCTVFSILYIKKSKQTDYTYLGFTLGLLSNVYLYFTEDMSEPSKESPSERAFKSFISQPKSSQPKNKPNVIIVLSESFWDISKLPGVSFSTDIIANFRKLTENYTHGSMVVTPFGGGTCNVEAEIFTGAPIRYFNPSNSFYHRYITHPVYSLPKIFSENGYQTEALHTFNKSFYNRDLAMSYMGFDTFKAKEDITDPVYSGMYISDNELTKMIIQSYEKKSKPIFIFGISMENHQPYTKNKYRENPIKISGNHLKENLKNITKTYAYGINNADKSLSELIRYFERVDEQTDIIFFGDHLGALGPLFALYKETGFISAQSNTLSLRDIKNLYSTEFVIWSNYNRAKKTFPNTSSNFLGNIILNHVGLKKTEIYQYMDYVYEKLHCINRDDLVIDAAGKMYDAIPNEYIAMDKHYRHLSRKLILSNYGTAD